MADEFERLAKEARKSLEKRGDKKAAAIRQLISAWIRYAKSKSSKDSDAVDRATYRALKAGVKTGELDGIAQEAAKRLKVGK